MLIVPVTIVVIPITAMITIMITVIVMVLQLFSKDDDIHKCNGDDDDKNDIHNNVLDNNNSIINDDKCMNKEKRKQMMPGISKTNRPTLNRMKASLITKLSHYRRLVAFPTNVFFFFFCIL